MHYTSFLLSKTPYRKRISQFYHIVWILVIERTPNLSLYRIYCGFFSLSFSTVSPGPLLNIALFGVTHLQILSHSTIFPPNHKQGCSGSGVYLSLFFFVFHKEVFFLYTSFHVQFSLSINKGFQNIRVWYEFVTVCPSSTDLFYMVNYYI